jgi:hypothetical protein
MYSDSYHQMPTLSTVEAIEQAAAQTGLDPEDILSLLDSGLEISDLLNYVNATISNRMN